MYHRALCECLWDAFILARTIGLDIQTFNHEGISPCLIASALVGACIGGGYNLLPLTPPQFYDLPLGNPPTTCLCSSVTYSMVSACGACQGGDVAFWSVWITDCSTSLISVGSFPLPIPQGIAVPAWAYLDVTSGNTWSATDAQDIATAGNEPDSSSPAPTSPASATSRSSSPGGGSTTTSTPDSSNSDNSFKPTLNIPAIAGGTAGGVVAITIIGIVIFFLGRRSKHRSRIVLSANGVSAYGNNVNPPGTSHPGITQFVPVSVVSRGNPPITTESAPTMQTTLERSVTIQSEQINLYDPAGPSTPPTCITPPILSSATGAMSPPPPAYQELSPTSVQSDESVPSTAYSDLSLLTPHRASAPHETGLALYGGAVTLNQYGAARYSDSTSYVRGDVPSSHSVETRYSGTARPYSGQLRGIGYTSVPTGSQPLEGP
ncbi:hypothetical protein K439DRAFT_591462 [Ramaria rubella]|nr:hypothetical protein K439DRAFT_591462 [Ramaria rubella]